MKRLTIVRHGQTFQNRDHIVQGSHPRQGRLTPLGMQQAELLGKALAGETFDLVYTSTLERAVLTTSLILMQRPGTQTLPIRFSDDLQEINLGQLHGAPQAEWKSAIRGDPMAWRAEGGESWLDVQERVTRYLHDVVLANGDRDILIVAHGGVNRGLLASLLDLSMGQTWKGAGVGAPQSNTCVNRIELDADGKVVSAIVNDTSHLAGEGLQPTPPQPAQSWNPETREWKVLGKNSGVNDAEFLAP